MDEDNPFADSDFEYARGRRERNPEAIVQRQRELKQPGQWLTDRYNQRRIDRQAANEDALEAQARAELALERRERLWDSPVEPRIESLMDEERRERER